MQSPAGQTGALVAGDTCNYLWKIPGGARREEEGCSLRLGDAGWRLVGRKESTVDAGSLAGTRAASLWGIKGNKIAMVGFRPWLQGEAIAEGRAVGLTPCS